MNSTDASGEEPMDTTTQELPPPPAPGPTSVRPPLVRRRNGRMLSGVARGLADYLGIDVVLVRVAFVLLAFAGVGIALYLTGWALIRAEDEERSVGDRLIERLHGASRWLVVVLGVGAGCLLLGNLSREGSVFWAVALIGIGVWLYQRDNRSPASAPEANTPLAPPAAYDAGHPGTAHQPAWQAGDQPAQAPWQTGAQPAQAPWQTGWQRTWEAGGADRPRAWAVRPPQPPRPRSFLARYTLAALLVVLGAVGTLDNLGVVHASARTYPALALLVVGAGMGVGSIWGRSRMLIVAGLLILPVAAFASLVRIPLRGGAGDRSYRPLTVPSVPSEYRLTAGQLRIDLTSLQWGSAPVTVRARLVTGKIDVVVPASVVIDFRGHVGAGDIKVADQERRSGVGVNLQSVLAGTQPDGPHLVLDAQAALGSIVVTRVMLPPGSQPVPPPAP